MSERANKILYMALSLLLAIVLWLYVDNEQGNTTSETYNNIPIEFIGAEDTLPNRNLMITSGADATINLRLSGPRSMISNLSRDDIRVQVNLTDINAEGSYPKNVSIYFPDNVDRTRINIEYQSRSTVTVQVAPLFSKTVAVSPNVVSNATPEGYIYMADLLVLEPSSLTLRGREEDVAKVAVARVTFDMSGATSTLHQELDYELLDSEGNVVPADGIRVSESRVEVTAPVYLFKDLPLTVKFKESPGSMVSDVDWELTDKTITVAGEPSNLETVEEISLGEVDLSELLSSFQEVPLDIPVPMGCKNTSGFTQTKLRVRFKNMETSTISVSNIIATGLAEGQQFAKVTNSVDVTLRGPAGEMEDITAEDVRIVVDLTDYGNGTVSVPATVYVDGHDNKIGAIGDYSVTVKISS